MNRTILLFLVFSFSAIGVTSAQAFKYKKKLNKYVWKASGQWNYDLQFDEARYQSEEGWYVANDGQWGLINEEGEILFPTSYDSIKWNPWSEYAFIKKNNLMGILNAEGETLIEPVYEDFDQFNKGQALVKKEGEWGIDDGTEFTPGMGTWFFKHPDQLPAFPGCDPEDRPCTEQAMLQTIYKNIRYPASARIQGVEGTIVLSLIIDEQGEVESVTILRDIGAGCGEEGKRVVQNYLDEWTPGMVDDHPARVEIILPIKFRLK